MSTAPPPPPPLPPMNPMDPRKSRAKVVAAIVVALIIVIALSGYLLVVAPRISIVTWTHADDPAFSSENASYAFNVTVKNSGILGGGATIECHITFNATLINITLGNTTTPHSYTGILAVKLGGGEQAEYEINVLLPDFMGVVSMFESKNWSVNLA